MLHARCERLTVPFYLWTPGRLTGSAARQEKRLQHLREQLQALMEDLEGLDGEETYHSAASAPDRAIADSSASQKAEARESSVCQERQAPAAAAASDGGSDAVSPLVAGARTPCPLEGGMAHSMASALQQRGGGGGVEDALTGLMHLPLSMVLLQLEPRDW